MSGRDLHKGKQANAVPEETPGVMNWCPGRAVSLGGWDPSSCAWGGK